MLGHIERVVFNSGDALSVDPSATVVLVGPNNTGKSQALRDIQSHLVNPVPPTQVVTRIDYVKSSSAAEVQVWLEERSSKIPNGPSDFILNRLGTGISISTIAPFWNQGPPFQTLGSQLAQLFTPTSVQALINNANLINPETDQASQALHFLFLNRDLERRLDQLCTEAFGVGMFLNRYGVPQLSLHFGHPPVVPQTEPPYPGEFLREVAKVPLMTNQGDGIKSFVGIALAAMTTPFQHLFLDEPEAFLHPPQARLLGRVLNEQHPDSQLFVATHDGNLLRGLLSGPTHNVAVWRMTRIGDSNRCVQLSSDDIRELWADPLLRTSNILEGLFHRGVVISEGDADARLYELTVADANPPVPLSSDLFYTFAGGKKRIPMVAKALRGVGVTVTVAVDFDVLREEEPLKSIIGALGGTWETVRPVWEQVRKGIDADTRTPSRATVKESVARLLDSSTTPSLSRQEQDAYRSLLHGETGWDKTKRSGIAGIPHGQLFSNTNELIALLRTYGLFVVPVGELEGWAPEVGGHGPTWLGAAVEAGVHKRNSALITFARDLARFALGA
jgi:AAA domain, putative AbiEii toxin, Type IV TA system